MLIGPFPNGTAVEMAKDDKNKNLFQKLTRLFKSGPVVRRKLRNLDTTIAVPDRTKSSGALLFQKSTAPTYATITANAYNLSERLMRYQDFCFSGDTRVATCDEEGSCRIDELVDRWQSGDTDIWTFSYDTKSKSIVAAKITGAKCNGVRRLLTVTLDDGSIIRCTPDHRFMLKDSSYVEAKDLQPGTALMRFSRRDFATPYRYVQTHSRGWKPEHVIVAEAAVGRLCEIGEHVHHKNFKHRDNRPQNLEILSEHDHMSLHAKINNLRFADPAQRKHLSDVMKSRWLPGGDLRENAYVNVEKSREANRQRRVEFNKTFRPGRFNAGRKDQVGLLNGNADRSLTYQDICNVYIPGDTIHDLASKLSASIYKIKKRLKWEGYSGFVDFSRQYENHKVVSVIDHGESELVYDIEVAGYSNFALAKKDDKLGSQGIVIVHNCEMEYTPEIAAAMDIYADETIATDEKGRSLHIYSDNEKIKEILEDLFYNTLNVEFNLRSWARNLPVHKDTPIPLLDGTTLTIENLAKKMKEEPGWIPWVYSIQDGTHRAVPGKVTWCDLTRKDSEIVRVWLDDGTYVDCTADHEWVLRDGTRMKAEDLTSGTSLMPFYRDVSSKKMNHRLDGYERVYDPCTELYEYTHRIVAENAVPNPEKWHVVHHVNFDKRNNDPTNLMKMTWSDHSILHQNASETLKRPDVVSKRMAGIDRWLRSDKHRSSAVDQLRKLQDVGLMRQSWDEYNASPQFAEDNEKRSLTMRGVWSSRRAELRDKMKIKFDGKCVDMIVEALRHEGKYLSPIRLGKILTSNSAFMTHFSSLNAGTHRDLTRTLSSHAGFESLLNKAGISSYLNLVSDRLPEIAATPWFKRALKKSERMSGVVPAMRDRHPSASQYMNHKVDRVERLTDRSDVYCMEVLGPQGEHDRHNFMVLSRHSDGSVNLNSGICSQNCKYGDFFLYNDVSPTHGVINAFPIPVNEIEREENYDPNDPMAVRFRWVTLGNRTLENWEVSHFRLLGNDMFLPYGSSVIEPARRIWRQLILIEDAMLVYRVVRAPERRVFYIDVANIPPENVPMYVEEQRKNLRSSQVIDRTTGRVDLRYNPLSVDEDYFIPVRGGESGTKIDTLAGGQNAAAVEDVAYIQKKLFAALKIPRAYLGYDESLSSKATLAQEDIRFSRTINVIQKTLISELNKLAIIHLYANGFDSEDLQNFTLRLSNPSTVAQQQKLELWRAKFEIAGSAPEGQMSKEFIRKEIWGLNDEQCIKIDDQRLKEKIVDATIEAAKSEGEDAGGGGEEGGGDLFGGEEGEEGEKAGEAESGGEESGGEDLFAGDDVSDKDDVSLLVSSDDPADDEDFPAKFSLKDIEIPVKAQRQLDRALYNRSRVRHHGPAKTHMPDFGKMVRHDSKSNSDPYDREWMRSYLSNPLGESSESPTYRTHISSDVLSSLKNMTNSSKFQTVHTPPRQTSPSVLIESNDLDGADAKEHEQTYIINDDESGDDR